MDAAPARPDTVGMDPTNIDTIAAIATAAGSGGVGIVRLSGPRARAIADTVAGPGLRPRQASHRRFRDEAGCTIDDGIVLLFPAPHSFTGEDVVELQGHGGPVVLQALVRRCCALGARQARPGEFSERAFLNGKLDLAQAEAIADLIAATDGRAARAARRSLEGAFSRRVDAIAEVLLRLRVHVEAAIDFADEPIDTLGGAQVRDGLADARARLAALLAEAEHGRRLRDGLHVVLLGPPNAGKSSLLNALAGSERAIVTDIAGTTRDVLRESVRLDGLELTLVDTAGLREAGDAIEREGMRRARVELEHADLVLLVLDARDPQAGLDAVGTLPAGAAVLELCNKADLLDALPADDAARLWLSAATGEGIGRLRARLRELAGGHAGEGSDGEFSARARHVEALRQARDALDEAAAEFAGERLELAAEQLRRGHDALGAITGRISADDMLGHIFSTFCIGK